MKDDVGMSNNMEKNAEEKIKVELAYSSDGARFAKWKMRMNQ